MSTTETTEMIQALIQETSNLSNNVSSQWLNHIYLSDIIVVNLAFYSMGVARLELTTVPL